MPPFIARGQGAPKAPAVAPVCHVSPPMQGAAPVYPPMPYIPPITAPTPGPNGQIDWSGLINAMLAMKAALEQLMRQRAPFWSLTVSQPGPGPSSKQQGDFGNFVVASQVTKTDRVYNPDDKSQYIDVERVAALTLTDKSTGQTWNWSR